MSELPCLVMVQCAWIPHCCWEKQVLLCVKTERGQMSWALYSPGCLFPLMISICILAAINHNHAYATAFLISVSPLSGLLLKGWSWEPLSIHTYNTSKLE